MITREKLKVGHLKIFGCPVYIHIPKEKRSKLDPSGKKGLLVGYSEQSKYFRIYIPGYCQIELSRDVTFDKDTTFTDLRENQEDEEEHEAPRVAEIPKPVRIDEEEQMLDDHDMT